MIFYSFSDKGLVREINEDSIEHITCSDTFCAIVADGLGGENSGEVASAIASSTMLEIVRENEQIVSDFDEDALSDLMMKSYQRINNKILLSASATNDYKGMSTTLLVAFIKDKKVLITHIGDCRAYLLHGSKLEILTKDHCAADSGYGKNLLIKYLGENNFVSPDIYKYNIMYGDVLLLCTDGLYSSMDEQELRNILRTHGNLEECGMNLANRVFENGANDNVSFVLVHNKPGFIKE